MEGAAFQLKERRPLLTVVERSDIRAVYEELRLQRGGAVSDDSAVGLGRVLGADTVLLYHIDAPTFHDRAFARMYRALPPVLVTSKLIRVESAEVLYHNVVTIPVGNKETEVMFFSEHPLVKAALDLGIAQTISDLQHAFR